MPTETWRPVNSGVADDVTWTPIIPPIECNRLIIGNRGSVDLKIRRVDTDATSEITVAPGWQQHIGDPNRQHEFDPMRHPVERTICYVQASSGTVPFDAIFDV